MYSSFSVPVGVPARENEGDNPFAKRSVTVVAAWITFAGLLLAAVVGGVLGWWGTPGREAAINQRDGGSAAVVQGARDVTINQAPPTPPDAVPSVSHLLATHRFVVSRDKAGKASSCNGEECTEIKVVPSLGESGRKVLDFEVTFPPLPSCPKIRELALSGLAIGVGRKASIRRPELDFEAEIERVVGEEIHVVARLLPGTNQISMARLDVDGSIADLNSNDHCDSIWLRQVASPGRFDDRENPGPFQPGKGKWTLCDDGCPPGDDGVFKCEAFLRPEENQCRDPEPASM